MSVSGPLSKLLGRRFSDIVAVTAECGRLRWMEGDGKEEALMSWLETSESMSFRRAEWEIGEKNPPTCK